MWILASHLFRLRCGLLELMRGWDDPEAMDRPRAVEFTSLLTGRPPRREAVSPSGGLGPGRLRVASRGETRGSHEGRLEAAQA